MPFSRSHSNIKPEKPLFSGVVTKCAKFGQILYKSAGVCIYSSVDLLRKMPHDAGGG